MFVAQVLWQPVNASAVECTEKPLTRLESSICSDTALHALDSELAVSLARAVDGGLIGKVQSQRIRNGIARKCRREPDARLPKCLLKAEIRAFERISMRLGEFPHEAQHVAVGQLLEIQQLLLRQLMIAESSFYVTGNARLTVTTIVELMKITDEMSPTGSTNVVASSPSTAPSVARLQQQLAEGCHHPHFAENWKVAVRDNGLECAQFNHSLPLYSASDFD